MKKFILGYENWNDDTLTEYDSKESAIYNSEEWCEVVAENIEVAKQEYNTQFAEWQATQQSRETS